MIPTSSALLKGRMFHNLLEKYPVIEDVKRNTEVNDLFDVFVNSELGKKYLNEEALKTSQREITIRLDIENDNLVIPCDTKKRKDIAFYGYVDYVNIIDDSLTLVDWKTGEFRDIKYQDFNQLLYYSIYFFLKYPNVNNINIVYCYVEHAQSNELTLNRQYIDRYKEELLNSINNIEKSNYSKNVSKLCDYCPYQGICSQDAS